MQDKENNIHTCHRRSHNRGQELRVVDRRAEINIINIEELELFLHMNISLYDKWIRP